MLEGWVEQLFTARDTSKWEGSSPTSRKQRSYINNFSNFKSFNGRRLKKKKEKKGKCVAWIVSGKQWKVDSWQRLWRTSKNFYLTRLNFFFKKKSFFFFLFWEISLFTILSFAFIFLSQELYFKKKMVTAISHYFLYLSSFFFKFFIFLYTISKLK